MSFSFIYILGKRTAFFCASRTHDRIADQHIKCAAHPVIQIVLFNAKLLFANISMLSALYLPLNVY
jgi:hypothetical protein